LQYFAAQSKQICFITCNVETVGSWGPLDHSNLNLTVKQPVGDHAYDISLIGRLPLVNLFPNY
jgi:hypothetical protein